MTLDLEPRDRNRLLAFAILLAVFIAGVLGGIAALHLLHGRQHAVRHHDERISLPFPHDGMPKREVIRMRHAPFGEELDLEPAQQAQIDSLMEEQSRKAEALMRSMEPRLKGLHDSTNAAIAALLTPEQQEVFERLQRERRDVIVRRFIRGPEPPDAPPSPSESGE
ncbi:MAG: hypothetical protein ABR559_08995 [Gemmatimonadota bacterium]